MKEKKTIVSITSLIDFIPGKLTNLHTCIDLLRTHNNILSDHPGPNFCDRLPFGMISILVKYTSERNYYFLHSFL